MYYTHENPNFESRSEMWCLNKVVDILSRKNIRFLVVIGSREFYPLQKYPDHLHDTPSPLFSGYQGSLSGAKRPGREVSHSSPSVAKVTNGWICTATFLTHVHGVEKRRFNLYHMSLK
jgi:hypothetical protein